MTAWWTTGFAGWLLDLAYMTEEAKKVEMLSWKKKTNFEKMVAVIQ
jgi:hypothetical protein